MGYLSCIEIEPEMKADASIIWLHGLGATNNDFVPVVPELQLPENLALRFVFPQAPSIPVTINGGMVMPAWYDILSMDIDRKIDVAQIKQSSESIKALIDRERTRGIASSRIVLAGFSQGGAVVYETALSYPEPLAGLLTLSTYFATHDSVAINPSNEKLPVMICHGSHDPVVPELLGHQAEESLRKKGFHPEYHSYPMQHEVCYPQIRDISEWLQALLLNRK